jgi:ribosomal protein L21E
MSNLDKKLKKQLEEGITVNTTSTNDDNVENNVNVTATGADAMELIQMLKMAGIGGQAQAPISVDEIPSEDEGCGCDMPNEIDSMRDMIGNMDDIVDVEIVALDDIEAVEEDAELANAPDEKYADTDTLVNKISGGLNRRKKAYAKAENGDNPMAVSEQIKGDMVKLDELEAEKDDLEQAEIDEGFKVGDKVKIKTSGLTRMTERGFKRYLGKSGIIVKDYGDGDMKVNLGGHIFISIDSKDLVKEEAKNESVQVTESEEELTTRLLKEYDEFKVTAPADSEEGNWEIENVGKWAVKIGNTENVEATDGELDLPFDTDLASALADEAMADTDMDVEEGLVEDDVEEGLRIVRKADNKCIGGHCKDDKEVIDGDDSTEDALDDEMSEDKK